MPAPATEPQYHFAPERPLKPLIVRGGLANTFGSLGGFTAFLFLGVGIYLLQETLSDPLAAQSTGLISGAFVIALATMLIYFMVSPRRRSRPFSRRRKSPTTRTELVVAVAQRAPDAAAEDLAMQV